MPPLVFPEQLDGFAHPHVGERCVQGVIVVSIVDQVVALEALDISSLRGDEVNAALASLTRVRSWLDARQAVLVRRLKALAADCPSLLPEADIAAALRGTRGDADRAIGRSQALGAVPAVEGALEAGQVSAAHVDVLGRALKHLTEQQCAQLTSQGVRLAEIASRSTPEQFARVLRTELARLNAHSGEGRLVQQRRDIGVRWWVNPETGMWCLRGEFDPDTGIRLQGRLENLVETMFHAAVPEDCPTGDRKQDHLRALALAHLIAAGGSGERAIDEPDNRFEVSVVIDLETLMHGVHEQSHIDVGSAAELPVESYRRMACMAAIIPVVLNSNGVVVDLGRSVRLATKAQRRALRVMYPTCAMPGCSVRSKHCEPHHLAWWRHNGTTDLHNLLPLCSRHHHSVHEGGVVVVMTPDRSLTITYPDGRVRTTGPPAATRAA